MEMFGGGGSRLARMFSRRIITAAVTLGTVGAVGVISAAAQGFSGPWDSAHEPPTINSAGVTVESGRTRSGFRLGIAPSVYCSAGENVAITVTFSDPSGSAFISPEPLVYPDVPCAFVSWTGTGCPESLDFCLAGSGGTPGDENASAEFGLSQVESKTTPFFYEVSGPSGVIAQAAVTAISYTDTGPPDIVTDIKSHDITECEREHLDIYAENGEVFCKKALTLTGGEYASFVGGWPAPQAPSPPTQTPKPKPKFEALTQATVGDWSEAAVAEHFNYNPQ
jgi:hypothetical protein